MKNLISIFLNKLHPNELSTYKCNHVWKYKWLKTSNDQPRKMFRECINCGKIEFGSAVNKKWQND